MLTGSALSHLMNLLAAGAAQRSWRGPILAFAGIAGIVLAAVLLFVLARRWRQRMQQDPSAAGDTLTRFRELRQQGELSQEEFQRIRSRLAEQIRRDLADTKKEGLDGPGWPAS